MTQKSVKTVVYDWNILVKWKVISGQTHRNCWKCGERKSLKHFRRCGPQLSGRYHWCIACCKKFRNEFLAQRAREDVIYHYEYDRHFRETQPEKKLAQVNRYRRTHPEERSEKDARLFTPGIRILS